MTKASKEPLISVMLPIYNVELFLEKSINSILNQTYKNIEVILVDDGSTDNSPKICDKFAKKDERIRVIHKKNGGVSDARNKCLDTAKGEYLTFIDPDDYVSTDYIEYLYKLILKYKTRMSSCGHYICYGEKQIVKKSAGTYKVTKIDALDDILYDKEIDIAAWGKLYEASLFKNIRYPKGKLFEDTATTYKLFDLCDYIAVGKECKYYYIMRDNSITNKSFNPNKMDLIYLTEEMNEYLNSKYDGLREACNRRLMWAYLSTYTKIVYTDKKDFIKEKEFIKNYISTNRKEVLNDKNIQKRDRISLIIYGFGDSIFRIAWSLYKKIFN